MGRLTWSKTDGSWGIRGIDWNRIPKEIYGVLCKLKKYEDTGLDPDKVMEMDKLYLAKCEEVNELKKQIETLPKAAGWINAEIEPPEGEYILLSFCNCSIPEIGRYEKDKDGGAYYIGDEDISCSAQDLFVNAWQPLPASRDKYDDEEEAAGLPVQSEEGLAPYCPVCGSAEHMYNEDGNENSHCGQCGTKLNWETTEKGDIE